MYIPIMFLNFIHIFFLLFEYFFMIKQAVHLSYLVHFFKLQELSLKYNLNQIQILPVGIGTYSNRPIAGPYCEIGL